jgi:WD40 repeat protein
VEQGKTDRAIDFFISYSPHDERWATWLAWALETSGYRTLLQAWDFVPGTNFIDFMDRGVRDAAIVVAVLSEQYLRSTYGRMEWQAALRADPDGTGNKLITVRIEDCPIDGLLATITYINLVGVTDEQQARARVLDQIRQALTGRAKPAFQPRFPQHGPRRHDGETRPEPHSAFPARRPRSRRTPINPPPYPLAAGPEPQARTSVTVLHVAGPRFGRDAIAPGTPASPAELQEHIMGDLTILTNQGVPRPDLIVVAGNITESAIPSQFEAALTFLTGLRVLVGLEPHRLVVVPGSQDVSHAASQGYFSNCKADEIEPQKPYWPKWRHYARLFDELYHGLDEPIFDSEQPWTLFAVPDLQVVVAGLNSTYAESHLEADQYGWLGEAQASWFAQWLARYQQNEWLRLGLMAHAPGTHAAYGDAAPGERGVLRDRTRFNRYVAPMLNLMLCGTPSSNAPAEAAVPLIGASRDGRAQLLQLGPTGMTRWVLGRDDTYEAGEESTHAWQNAGATFTITGLGQLPSQRRPAGVAMTPSGAASGQDLGSTAQAMPQDPHGEQSPRRPEPEPTANPAVQLLDRVREVCEARYERVRIRHIGGQLPHLFVTYRQDSVVRQQRVGAHLGTPTAAEVDVFTRQVHATNPDILSELVYDGPRVPLALYDEALRQGVRVVSLTEFQGLLDLRSYVTAQTTRLQNDRLYPPGLYVPQRFRHLAGTDSEVHEDLVSELQRMVTSPDGRFVLLLADFGRGKTFALRELARRLPTAAPDLIPILVELRALDKAHSAHGLVAAHLANHGEDRIDLRAFRYMLREGRVVLLFDGFDELVARVSYERAADHLETLLHAAEGNAKIVVTSRTQHFRTSSQVFTALGERVGLLPHRRVLGIEDFSSTQIRTFLQRRYSGDDRAAELRLDRMKGIQDLLGLSSNPRMLSFIANLEEERLAAVANASHTISAAALYWQILDSWLKFEEQRTATVPGVPPSLDRKQLWQAVSRLAMRLWETNEPFLRLAELTDVAGTLTELATEAQLSREQAAHAVGAGSLLIRTEEGLFGFIHTSVVEWLVAREIAERLSRGEDPPALGNRLLSQLSVDFLCDLADTARSEAWTAQVLTRTDAGDISRANAMRLSARLRMPARADLRGARLKGEDFSHRELSGVDLTGADLSDARLVETNLRGAILRETNLAGARLDEAKLTNADLSGASFNGARLMRTDLRGVTVAGSSWRRAALIDVTADPALLEAPELAGAVVAPRDPVIPGLAPPAVGVSYGFEVGRIPTPVGYSPDGSTLAIGSDDGGVLICDAGTGQPVRTLQGHRSRVYAVLYDGLTHQLVTGAADRTIRLWDADRGEQRHVVMGFSGWVWPVLTSPRQGILAVGDADGVVRIVDTATGIVQHELAGHAAPIWTAAFHPVRPLLVVADSGGVIRAWDLRTGQLRHEVAGGEAVYRVAFQPDGESYAAGGHDGRLWLHDAVSGECRHQLRGHEGHVYALDFQPEGNVLVSGDTHGAVRVWDPTTGRGVGVLRRHRGAVYNVQFSPDGSMFATGDSDGVVRLWDPVDRQLRHELTGHRGSVWPVAFRPTGGQAVTSSNDGTTRLWDTATGQWQRTLRGHGRRINSVDFRTDGSMLSTCGNDGIVRLWDPHTGQQIKQLVGTPDRMISAVFCPNSSLLAAASGDGGVYLWNTDTGADERELNVGTKYVWAANFSPDGDMLATANDDDSVRLWYPRTGREIHALTEHRGRVRSVAFSPDGETVATGCDDRKVRLWEVANGECRAILEHHTDRVYAVEFSPDGTLLISASNDGTAVIWDVRTGERRQVLTEHDGQLWTAAFSPDGSLLATAGDDLVVRLWDPGTGRVRRVLTAHTRPVLDVVFSPDSTMLASAGDDGTVRLWDVVDPDRAELRLTLVGLADGWAALSPDGRYKMEGDVAGQLWHTIGTFRFEPGELDPYLAQVRRLPQDALFD